MNLQMCLHFKWITITAKKNHCLSSAWIIWQWLIYHLSWLQKIETQNGGQKSSANSAITSIEISLHM